MVPPGQSRAFDAGYAHDVRNVSLAPAVSIHAYSPPLTEMNEYQLDGSQLVPRERASERAQTLDRDVRVDSGQPANRAASLNIEQVLSTARARLRRLSPEEASEAVDHTGAILVDIRPEGQRAMEGRIPGALLVERNVLEWRLDPASGARLPVATNHDLEVSVLLRRLYLKPSGRFATGSWSLARDGRGGWISCLARGRADDTAAKQEFLSLDTLTHSSRRELS